MADPESALAALRIVLGHSGVHKVIAEDRSRSLPLATMLCIIRTRVYYRNVVDQINRMCRDFHEEMNLGNERKMLSEHTRTFWVRRHFSEMYPWVYLLRKNRWRDDLRYNFEIRCIDQWRETVLLMSLNYSDYTRRHLASGGRSRTPHPSRFRSLSAPLPSPLFLDRSNASTEA